MNINNLVSLILTSLNSLSTSNIFHDALSDNMISDLLALNSMFPDLPTIDFKCILSILSISDFTNFSCVNILVIVAAILSVIGLGKYYYNIYQSTKYRNSFILTNILLMNNDPANNRAFSRFIEILNMKVAENNRNRVADLRFFKPGLGVPYRSLTIEGSLTIKSTRSNQYMIIDNNDKYGIAILGMKDLTNRGMVVVKHNGEWLVGCLYEGSDRYMQTDLLTGNNFRAFPVAVPWYNFHNGIGRGLTSNGKALSLHPGQKTTTLYEIERFNLQRRFHE